MHGRGPCTGLARRSRTGPMQAVHFSVERPKINLDIPLASALYVCARLDCLEPPFGTLLRVFTSNGLLTLADLRHCGPIIHL